LQRKKRGNVKRPRKLFDLQKKLEKRKKESDSLKKLLKKKDKRQKKQLQEQRKKDWKLRRLRGKD
jgi:hypothetical protein